MQGELPLPALYMSALILLTASAPYRDDLFRNPLIAWRSCSMFGAGSKADLFVRLSAAVAVHTPLAPLPFCKTFALTQILWELIFWISRNVNRFLCG